MSFTSLPQLAGFMQVLGLSGWQWTMNSGASFELGVKFTAGVR